jgi:hypothetical protein
MLLHTFVDIASALGVDVPDLLPAREKALKGVDVNLLASRPPEERSFIERAIGAGGTYENKDSTTNKNGNNRTLAKEQNRRRAG